MLWKMLPTLLIKGSALVAKCKFKGLSAPSADVTAAPLDAIVFCPVAGVIDYDLAAEPARLQRYQ
jgi:hypothetical protein